MECIEQQGIYSLSLYEYKNIKFHFPDLADDTTYDLLSWGDSFSKGYFIEYGLNPRLERENGLNSNYNQYSNNKIVFWIQNENKAALQLLKEMQCNRNGFLPEFVGTNDVSFCFDTPYFVSEVLKKTSEDNVTVVTMKPRIKSNGKQLFKTNQLTFAHSYIKTSNHSVMGLQTANGIIAATANQ